MAVGHLAVAVAGGLVGGIAYAGGVRDEPVPSGWSAAWVVGALVVLVLAVRLVGRRSIGRGTQVWTGAAAWVLVPVTWAAAAVGVRRPGLFPAGWLATAFYFSPVLLGLAAVGALVTWAAVARR